MRSMALQCLPQIACEFQTEKEHLSSGQIKQHLDQVVKIIIAKIK